MTGDSPDSCGAEAGEIMVADQGLGRVLHGRRIERGGHVPEAARLQGQRCAAVEDAVAICPVRRREPGMEVLIHFLDIDHGRRARVEMEVDGVLDRVGVGGFLQVRMRDLPQGVHAGVGPSCRMQGDGLAAERKDGLLDRSWTDGPVILALPTDEGGRRHIPASASIAS